MHDLSYLYFVSGILSQSHGAVVSPIGIALVFGAVQVHISLLSYWFPDRKGRRTLPPINMEPDRGCPFKRKIVHDPPDRFHVNWWEGSICLIELSLGQNGPWYVAPPQVCVPPAARVIAGLS